MDDFLRFFLSTLGTALIGYITKLVLDAFFNRRSNKNIGATVNSNNKINMHGDVIIGNNNYVNKSNYSNKTVYNYNTNSYNQSTDTGIENLVIMIALFLAILVTYAKLQHDGYFYPIYCSILVLLFIFCITLMSFRNKIKFTLDNYMNHYILIITLICMSGFFVLSNIPFSDNVVSLEQSIIDKTTQFTEFGIVTEILGKKETWVETLVIFGKIVISLFPIGILLSECITLYKTNKSTIFTQDSGWRNYKLLIFYIFIWILCLCILHYISTINPTIQ